MIGRPSSDHPGYSHLGKLDPSGRVGVNQTHSNSHGFSAINGCVSHLLLRSFITRELPLPLEEWLVEALAESGVDCLPVTCEISRMSVALQDKHKDPADRIIIATAIIHDALLASVDSVSPDPELSGRLIAR